MKKFDTTNYAAPVTMTNSATMPMRALGPKDIARAFDKWHKRHRVADRETARRVWDAAADYYGRAPVPAIAPPVAAGSVDTSPSFADHMRWVMAGIHKGHGAEGVAIANMHAWHVACGAQQREQGWVAGRINGAKVFDKTESAVLAAAERLLRDTVVRAEKAEARLRELEEKPDDHVFVKCPKCGTRSTQHYDYCGKCRCGATFNRV